tara:strand:+ start:231 stop:542 length:312 start_codon:yes stop_codon:yes gene_type:complete
MKKSTSTFRVCENRLTPIQWATQLLHCGQYVNPPKKYKPKVYTTKSLGKLEGFQIYDNQYNAKIKKLWEKIAVDLATNFRTVKSLNEWEKMLVRKFGKIIINK